MTVMQSAFFTCIAVTLTFRPYFPYA